MAVKWWFGLVANPWFRDSLMFFLGLGPVAPKIGRVVCLGISWIVRTHKIILQPSPNQSYQHHICHFQIIHFHHFAPLNPLRFWGKQRLQSSLGVQTYMYEWRVLQLRLSRLSGCWYFVPYTDTDTLWIPRILLILPKFWGGTTRIGKMAWDFQLSCESWSVWHSSWQHRFKK